MAFDLDQTLLRLKAGANRLALLPYSTLIVAMGDHWEPGAKEAVMAMREYSREQGKIEVELVEEQDRCFLWGDALGSMRNMGYRRAIEGGFEWLLYVDNDVQPPPHALIQLLSRHMAIIAPKIVYADGDDHGMGAAKLPSDQGMVMVGSTVLSLVLFRTSIFYPYADVDFWGNSLGDDEEYHYIKLALRGLRPFVDTDLTVTCLKPPHFPLDFRRNPEAIKTAREERDKARIYLLGEDGRAPAR